MHHIHQQKFLKNTKTTFKINKNKFFFLSFFNPIIRSDTESAVFKQSKAKKYQINFEGLFKKKPQKLVDVEKNNADAHAEDPNDDAAPSEATVIMEDDPPKSVSLILKLFKFSVNDTVDILGRKESCLR